MTNEQIAARIAKITGSSVEIKRDGQAIYFCVGRVCDLKIKTAKSIAAGYGSVLCSIAGIGIVSEGTF
jgi:hypothetical protein